MKKRVKCNQCHQEQDTSTIFIHIVDCDRNVRHRARQLIAELEELLSEQE